MGNFQLSEEARSDVLRVVQSLGAGAWDSFEVSAGLRARISTSLDEYLAAADSSVDPAELARELRLLTQLVLAVDPGIGLIRSHVAELSDPAVGQIEERAIRLAEQVTAFSDVGLDLRGWARCAEPAELVRVLRLEPSQSQPRSDYHVGHPAIPT